MRYKYYLIRRTANYTFGAIALLQKGSRHLVHLSPDAETVQRMGARRGKPVLLAVDAAVLHAATGVSYRCGNGVWLVEQVPPQYLREL